MPQFAPMTIQHRTESERLLQGSTKGDPVIDTLRGVAACMIMVNHYASMVTSNPGLWGFAGTRVDLFFVISGYVFAPYLTGRPLRVSSYLVRRFFRLVPLYWFALGLYVVLKLVNGANASYLWQHLFFLQTMESLEIAYFYNPALWTLPPEVEYCLMLPVLAWWTARYGFMSLLVLSIVMRLALVFAGDPASSIVDSRAIATVHLPGFLSEYSLGTFAYLWAKRAPTAWYRGARLILGIFLLAGVLWLFEVYVADVNRITKPSQWITGNIGLAAAVAYMAIVSALAGSVSGKPSRALFVLQGLGFWSYGIYLFHNAMPQILQTIGFKATGPVFLSASVILTLGFAWLMHHVLERPAREWGRALGQAFKK